MRTSCLAVLLFAACALSPRGAAGAPVVPIDGALDPAYGAALSTQTVQTTFQDTPAPYGGVGTELDGAYGFVADGVLHLFVTGNMGFCCGFEFSHEEEFDIFIDSGPGGQNTLQADNPNAGCCWDDPHPNALHYMTGLTFDPGFAPDHWFETTINMSSWYAALPAGGGGQAYYLGYYSGAGPGGTLTGGTNPSGIMAAIDNGNAAGVTQGCGAASGAGVSAGFEMAIPLAAIGNPTDCIRVCVVAAATGGAPFGDQVLGPLPAGTCALGDPGAVNFASIPGDQYFTVCAGLTPAHASTWGALKTNYR
jgi:hypothetical protein